MSSNYTGYDYLPVENGHIVNPNKLLLFDDHKHDQISNETFMGIQQ